MDFSFTEEQRALRKTIIQFTQQELNAGAQERDSQEVFSRELWQKCGELRLQGLAVPEEYGGAGLDPLSTAIAFEALGYGCRDGGLVFAIGAHFLACVVPILAFGDEAQKRQLLPDLCNGNWIAVNAMTEPNSGSDAFAMKTRAELRDQTFVINGTKTFCSNGPVADVCVTYAKTDPDRGYHGGITAFIVQKGTPGYSVGQTFHKMGLRSSPISEIVFQNCEVDPQAVVGGVGGGSSVFNHSMAWERVCLAAAHVGTMERLLEDAVKYARERQAFGSPISKFQAISHRIADIKIQLEAARLLVYRSAWKLERTRDVALDASVTKVFVSESLVNSALSSVQVLGGYGFMAEYDVERVLRDSIGSTLYSGTNEIHRNIIARWLGL